MANLIAEAWQQSFRPKDRRPIYEWAEEFIILPGSLTKSGRFSVQDSRHFIGPLDALHNDRKRAVNVLAPPRSGKTLIADIWMPWTFSNEPGNFLWIFQKDTIAGEHCELRVMPILEACELTRALLPTDKSKKRKQEIIFSNGFPLFVWGPSINNLQSKGFRYIVEDEPWLYDKGVIGEADARTGDFAKLQNEKILRISQGGDVGTDWHKKYNEAEILEWSVQCQGCSKYFIPIFSGFRQDKSRYGIMWDEKRRGDGTRDIAKTLPTVRLECQHCGHPHIDGPRTKSEWNRTGRYELTTEPNEKRSSFHWNSIIDTAWTELAEKWLLAENQFELGNEQDRIQFIQKQLAEFYDPNKYSGMQGPRIIDISQQWADEFMRVMTVDVQQHDFWAVIRAWAKSGESRLLWAGRLISWDEIRAKQLEFKVYDGSVLVDSGYNTREVYQKCVEYGHVEVVRGKQIWVCWKATKGEPAKSFPFFHKTKGRIDLPYRWPISYGDPLSGTQGQGKGQLCPLLQYADTALMEILFRLRDGKGAPWMAYEGVCDEWSKHMYAMRRIKVWDKLGQDFWKFENVGRRPNHLLDCEKVQVLAACMEGIIGDAAQDLAA